MHVWNIVHQYGSMVTRGAEEERLHAITHISATRYVLVQ